MIQTDEAVATPPQTRSLWISLRVAVAALLGALVVAFFAYEPALRGPFVFDDYALPFRFPGFRSESFRDWISTVRPVLMASYYLNYRISGQDSTLSYHLLNLIIHAANSVLVGVILMRLLRLSPVRAKDLLLFSAAGAGIFLLHPLQTESVAYIAGRSESLSAFWALCAFAVFLYTRDSAISWRASIAILLLFGAAAASKEHAVALCGVFVLTDVFFESTWSLAGIRRNWRLYVPLAAAGLVVVAVVFRVLASSDSAGFAVPGMSSYEYALTQARVLLLSVSLFVLPVGLTVDHDFAISRSLLDHGAILAVLVWVAVLAAAILWRRKYPVVCYGVLLFLILLAPTSSFIPIKDVVAERRMYLPILGLLLIALDAVSRLKMSRPALASVFGCVLIALGIGTYERSKAWGDSEALWKSAVEAAPKKARPYANLASLYLVRRQCAQGLQVIDRAAEQVGRVDDSFLLATWGLTLECTGDRTGAIEKMRLAVAQQPSSQSYTALAKLYIDSGMSAEAEQALAEAQRLDANWELTYVYRALMLIRRNEQEAATAQLRHALSINPSNPMAQQLLGQIVTRSRSAQ